MAAPGSVPGSKRALKHEELRQRIYDAALTLFRRKGVADTTIREIAHEACVGVGTFFNYFDGKAGVLEELGRQRQQRLEALANDPAVAALPTRARLEALLRALVEGMEEEPALTRAIVRAALSSPALFHGERARFLTLTRLLAEVMRAGQARGEVAADCDIEVAAQLLISIYATLILDWTAGSEPVSASEPPDSPESPDVSASVTPLSPGADGAAAYALLPTLLAHLDTLWRGVAPRRSLDATHVR